MTVIELHTMTLRRCDEDDGAQNQAVWQAHLRAAYERANLLLCAHHLRMAVTEPVTAQAGGFAIDALSRPCLAVLSVRRGERELPFTRHDEHIRLICQQGETLSVRYRAMPLPLGEGDQAVPDLLPEAHHGLLSLYAAMELCQANRKYARALYFQQRFEQEAAQAAALRPDAPERLTHRWAGMQGV